MTYYILSLLHYWRVPHFMPALWRSQKFSVEEE